MSELLFSPLIYCSDHKIDHRITVRRSVTNYHHTIIGRKILLNMMTVNTMSFAMCLHRIGSIASCYLCGILYKECKKDAHSLVCVARNKGVSCTWNGDLPYYHDLTSILYSHG